MAVYRLEPIATIPTLRIVLGNETVGFAYPPRGADTDWQIDPKCLRTDGLPDGDLGFKTRRFESLEAVEAFLGIAREALVA